MLRRYGLRLFIGSLLVAAFVAIIGTREYVDPEYVDPRQHEALTKNVYWEALKADEPELSSRFVAYVTGVRAKANKPYWGGPNIHDVVYKRLGKGAYMFDWSRNQDKVDTPVGDSKMWVLAKSIAHDELRGKFTLPPRLAHLAGTDHYLNPEASDPRQVCWFKISLVLLGKAEVKSRHVFYRTPKNAAEKALLPKASDVEECKPKKKPPKKGATTAAR